MSDEETKTLLREIRDLLRDREQKYDDYLEKYRNVTQKDLEAHEKMRKSTTWDVVKAFLLVMILSIVFVRLTDWVFTSL